ALRFEGFTDPWEQRKLGEYLCVSAETNKAYEFSREDVLSVSGEYGVVNQVEFQGRSFAGANVSGYGILRTGDLVYTKSPLKTNPYGIIKANLGRSGIVSTLYATYKTKNEANPRFIDVYFSLNPRVNRYLYPLVNKGAKNDMKVSAENAIRGYVVFPSLTEQAEIGALFAKIDSLIALHQRKYEKLKTVKQSLLEKMFPKEGEDVPELRFEGFTDPWEQRKLGEVVDVHNGKDYKHLKPGSIPVYGTGGLMTYVDDALSKNEDAVGVGRKGTIDQPYKLRAPFWTVDTLFYAVPKAGNDIEFVLCCFQRINWKAKDESTGLPSLSKSAINNTRLLTPRSGEQVRIGALFAKIDSLIALHQRELEILKNLKKALLEKMFV
ncbi:restriction endonuclease subunit S, partial [Adlercreutzia equolifaciens]|uniref:restriction endonuclease subunit S n=1 Tax=Adlercreutzia equolifaciens TaxID=446660 RepID=UPI00266EAC95